MPFRVSNLSDMTANGHSMENTQSGFVVSFEEFYTTELLSRGGFKMEVYVGYGAQLTSYTNNFHIRNQTGGTYLELETRELGVRVSPTLSTSLSYAFNNGSYLRSTAAIGANGLGYRSIENEIVQGTGAEITYTSQLYSEQSGVDNTVTATSFNSGVTYGLSSGLEFSVSRKFIRAANDPFSLVNFGIGMKL